MYIYIYNAHGGDDKGCWRERVCVCNGAGDAKMFVKDVCIHTHTHTHTHMMEVVKDVYIHTILMVKDVCI